MLNSSLKLYTQSLAEAPDEFYLDGVRLYLPVLSYDAGRKLSPVAASPGLQSASLSLETRPAPWPSSRGMGAAARPLKMGLHYSSTVARF